jgi:hypothetical protein
MMKTFILHSEKPLKVLPVRKSDDYSSQRETFESAAVSQE